MWCCARPKARASPSRSSPPCVPTRRRITPIAAATSSMACRRPIRCWPGSPTMSSGTMSTSRSRSASVCPSIPERAARAAEGEGMAEDREPFLKRWARLKAEQSKPEPPEPAPPSSPAVSAPANESPEIRPEDLPPVEELTAASDFTPFLKAGVPEELKRLALRKLWRSDPVFANLDGLVEHGEDFGAAFRNPGPVATLFRIGRAMPGPGDAEEEQKEQA